MPATVPDGTPSGAASPRLAAAVDAAPALDPADVRHVAVLRALPGLGDLLCGVPSLRALRRAWPDARITLVGLPGAAWFVERFAAYVDDLMAVTSFPGLPELSGSAADSLAFLAAAQSHRFDVAVQLHGSGATSNVLLGLLGARISAGSHLGNAWCPDPQRFVEYRGVGHEIDRLLDVVAALGVPDQGRHLEWPRLPGDDHPVPGVPPGPIACLHPGSSLPSRRWPVARFAEVGDHLAEAGLGVVVTGTAGERALADEVTARMRRPACVVAGRTSLGQLGSLLGAAALVVTNDTGTSHLAAAVRAPSVVVFTVSDQERWAPLDRARHRVVAVNGPTVRSCASRHCLADGCARITPEPAPLPEDGIDLVLAHCEDLLSRAGDPRAGDMARGDGRR
jgi:ADP-heptose:LPS heptosyltransferase